MQMEWDYVGAVVFSGLAIVFAALVLLIIFVSIMGKVFTSLKTKKSQPAPVKAAAAPAAPAPKAAAEAPADENGVSDEIIAVIAAAVAAMGAADGKTYAVKSVKKSASKPSRSAWANAAAAESTRAF